MSAFLQLTLSLAIIILAAKAGGYIATRLRQPAVLGELLVGLVLGPTVIDLVHLSFVSNPELLQEEISNLASLGVVLVLLSTLVTPLLLRGVFPKTTAAAAPQTKRSASTQGE